MAPIDLNRKTAGIELPANLSSEIWGATLDHSVVQQLATKVALPAGGLTIQTIESEPEAEWVGETEKKPVGTHTFGAKKLQPYKMALIEPFSDEFRRDLPTLYAELERRLPYALGRLFDKTVFGAQAAPGEHFDTLADAPEIALDGTTKSYFSALSSVSGAGYDVTGWALTPAAEIEAMQIVDQAGRPLLMSNLTDSGQIGSVLGRGVRKFKSFGDSDLAGVAGDWSQAKWGQATPIKISMSNEASLTLADGSVLNLWQQNMFALRVEVEMGFNVRDVNAFAKFTAAEAGA